MKCEEGNTKENILKLLDICSENNVYGILFFGVGLTLREGNREYFYKKLDQYFPGLKEIYIKQYGLSYEILSPNNNYLSNLFHIECEKRGILHDNDKIFKYLREYPHKYTQLSLFNIE